MEAPPVVVLTFAKRLVAVNAHTGQRVWELETGTNLGRLFVVDGLVVYLADRQIFCADYATGALRWKAPMPILAVATVMIYAGCLLAAGMGEVVSFALANGQPLWHDKFKGYGSSSGAMAAPGVAVQVDHH